MLTPKERIQRLAYEAPIYKDDYWHNIAALTWDVWPKPGSWKHRLVRYLLPDLSAVLDTQKEAENRYLFQNIFRKP